LENVSDKSYKLLYRGGSHQSDGSLETWQHLWSSWWDTKGDPERQFGWLVLDTEM